MIDYEKGLIGSKKRLWPCPEGTDPAGGGFFGPINP